MFTGSHNYLFIKKNRNRITTYSLRLKQAGQPPREVEYDKQLLYLSLFFHIPYSHNTFYHTRIHELSRLRPEYTSYKYLNLYLIFSWAIF